MTRLAAILFSIWVLFGSMAQAHAADSVNFSANVVARKSTDTMNDFDLTNINPDVIPINNSGLVKGVSTAAKNDFNARIIAFELGAVLAVSIVVLLFYFMRKKQRAIAKSHHEMIAKSGLGS